jgi:hypothetical protein
MLKIAGGVMLAGIFDLKSKDSGRAEMTRMRWVERDVFPASGTYRSPVFTAEQQFNSVELGWIADMPPGSALEFEVRTSADGEGWTDWNHMHRDPHVAAGPGERTYAAPHLTVPSSYVQYQLRLVPSESGTYPSLEEVEIGCVDTSPPAQFMDLTDPYLDGWIIPRAGWGANEELRYRDGEVRWTPRFEPVEKVIVHHTATDNGGSDPPALVRAIYYYHAVTLGWGDIGYNYLIDWQGNVYEGRFGGPEVVGAHSLQYNRGSMGVAVIGNFQWSGASQPALDSLVRLIRERTPEIDPAGAGAFHDKALVPNICSHRDVLETECPGDHLYARLPEIRGWVKGTGPISDFGTIGPTSGEITNVRMSPSELYAGSSLRVDITVRNTGSYPMFTQGPPPNYIYREGEDFRDAEEHRIERMYRVGVDFDGNGGLPNPWRWGLPDRLAPGESTTVTGFVRLDSVREWNLSASLISELVRYDQQHVFPHRIVTLGPPTSPASQSADPTMRYFEVTQHNVPAVFYSYWERNGGLERFGYPLTEAVMEISETDGETYLTQYFERARFEHHPEFAGTQYEVLLGLLGSERTAHRLGELPFRPVPAFTTNQQAAYFPETGHTLRTGFRRYWNQNGGLPIFGFPISEEFEEMSQTDGKTYVVQYFERNRFEWHPEFIGTPHEILLGHLGREVLIDRGWLDPDF